MDPTNSLSSLLGQNVVHGYTFRCFECGENLFGPWGSDGNESCTCHSCFLKYYRQKDYIEYNFKIRNYTMFEVSFCSKDRNQIQYPKYYWETVYNTHWIRYFVYETEFEKIMIPSTAVKWIHVFIRNCRRKGLLRLLEPIDMSIPLKEEIVRKVF